MIATPTFLACCLCLVPEATPFSPSLSLRVSQRRLQRKKHEVLPLVSVSKNGVNVLGFDTSLEAATEAVLDDSAEEKEPNRPKQLAKLCAVALAFSCVFAVGFRLGGGNVEVLRASLELQRRRFPILSVVGVVMLVRDGWRAIPAWMKPSLLRRFSRSKDADTESEEIVKDDMTDLDVVVGKLQKMLDLGQAKLNKEGEEDVPTTKPMLALIQLLSQLRERRPQDRMERYANSGSAGGLRDVEGLDQAFEWADLAYDESLRGPLKAVLEEEGFSLLKHDKTALPGYVGHYVAISKERKLAIIGVKGTSSFEDMLTDLCGLSVPSTLDAPFVPGGETTIRCHEGILISSKRLVDDLQPFVEKLLLPSGYKILLIGHSLGAAGAAMLALFLRSRIPQLASDTQGDLLRALAFACPPILDFKNAADCSSFITTIVNNSDVIPRTSLSNLMIALEVLKDVNTKLVEKGLDGSTAKSSVALLQKFAEGTKGELLMSPEELRASRTRAAAAVELEDPDHLYVPGKVVTMYDKWESKNDDETAAAGIEEQTAEGFITSPNGAIDVLRTIDMNERMISDHLAPSYRSSLKSVLELAGGGQLDKLDPGEQDFQ